MVDRGGLKEFYRGLIKGLLVNYRSVLHPFRTAGTLLNSANCRISGCLRRSCIICSAKRTDKLCSFDESSHSPCRVSCFRSSCLPLTSKGAQWSCCYGRRNRRLVEAVRRSSGPAGNL